MADTVTCCSVLVRRRAVADRQEGRIAPRKDTLIQGSFAASSWSPESLL